MPILLRTKEAKHYQCVAAVYRSSTKGGNKVSMRLVTRALTGVCDNCYYNSQCCDKPSLEGQPMQLRFFAPSKLSTERIFQCRLNNIYDQLQCLVFIPTSIQTTESGSNHSLVSGTNSCHKFGKKGNQDICVSDTLIEDIFVSYTLIDELVSLNAFLQEQSYNDISLTDSMVHFSRICTTRKFAGIIHLLLGHKDVRKETVWLYAYFIRQTQTLIFLPCSSDLTRDVLMAASTIKNYLQPVLKSKCRYDSRQ